MVSRTYFLKSGQKLEKWVAKNDYYFKIWILSKIWKNEKYMKKIDLVFQENPTVHTLPKVYSIL